MSWASSSTARLSWLPGETKETIQETLNFAKEINPHTILDLARRALSARSSTAGEGERLAVQRGDRSLTEEGTKIAP